MRSTFVAIIRNIPSLASACFGALTALSIIGVSVARDIVAEAHAEKVRIEGIAQLQHDEREVDCLTNIVHHEARGESVLVRKRIAQTVRAIVADPDMKMPRTICGLAKVKGFFSDIKDVERRDLGSAEWMNLRIEASDLYYASLVMPRGWGCVRAFRVSDDKLEKLSGKQLAQLGFTMEAKGLKFFAAHRVPVDTVGNVTFYSPRGGCRHPTRTF